MKANKNLESVFNFLHKIENLKSTLRYNKTTTGRQESSAEHSWRLALCTFILAEELDIEVDVNRAVKIALVHDLAEAITGDIDSVLVAEGEISEEEKEEQEIKAIKGLEETLPEDIGEEISGLWHEYNDGKTPEAKFTKALDKIETLIQLIECGYEMYDKPGFIANYADKAVKAFPQLSPVLKIVKEKLKEEFKKGDIEWKEEYDYFD